MTDLTEQEIWKSMPEFDNQYEVSNMGRFRSIDRMIIRRGNQVKIKGRILKGRQDAYGYVTMTIKNKQVKAHRLVAKHFIENPLNKSQVNHKNGIKSDNRAINLEWCSHEENMKHLFLTMPYEHKNTKQKRMEREDLIKKLTIFVESKTIEDVKNSWVSAKNIMDVLGIKYNKTNVPIFYEEWKQMKDWCDNFHSLPMVIENEKLKEELSRESYKVSEAYCLVEELKELLKEIRSKVKTVYDFDTREFTNCAEYDNDLLKKIDEVLNGNTSKN